MYELFEDEQNNIFVFTFLSRLKCISIILLYTLLETNYKNILLAKTIDNNVITIYFSYRHIFLHII